METKDIGHRLGLKEMGRGKLGMVGHGVGPAHLELDPESSLAIGLRQQHIHARRIAEQCLPLRREHALLGAACPAGGTEVDELGLQVLGKGAHGTQLVTFNGIGKQETCSAVVLVL